MDRDVFNHQALGTSMNDMVKAARILMVGAGGIGCELLKNLVLTGFGEVHIVDLDTIDLSNLNRQFLFRQEHIKKSKAMVAREAAHNFNPSVRLEAYHANIKDSQFNVDWFKGFSIVFNALDNLDARRHVNRMCLAADVPLIESGTTGFNGQVQVIKKGRTACYDCTTKETPKSYPVCTIRSTPSQPIHCIVWGKSYLLSEIFGISEDESPEMDHSEDSENAREIENLHLEAQALKKIKEAIGSESFPQLLFNKVYKDDIERLKSMEEMWKTRNPPTALDYASIIRDIDFRDEKRKAMVLHDGQRAWNLQENVIVFNDSLQRLSRRLQDMRSAMDKNADADEPLITFDKDDEDTLDFVTASANLRSITFGISTKSRFDVKQMAGNIIPAIATTNAIVAGLCVLESFKVIRGDYSLTKEIFLSPFVPERLLASDVVRAPNPHCPVCSVAQTRILVDMSRATLGDLVDDFLRLELGYGEEIVVNNDVGLLYDIDETENLTKKLTDLGIRGDSFLTVIDEDEENPRVNLVIYVREASAVLADKPIKTLDVPTMSSPSLSSPIPRRKQALPETALPNGHQLHNGSREQLAHTDGTPEHVHGKKRLASETLDNSPKTKRSKIVSNGRSTSETLVIIDETANGSIVIDD